MIYDGGLKDNLTLRREGTGRKPWLTLVVVVVVIAAAGGTGWYAWKYFETLQNARQARLLEPPRLGPEQQVLAQVRALAAAKELAQAREQAYRALGQCKDPEVIRGLEGLLGEINMELLFSPAAMPEKIEYVVADGDSLERIAKKFGTTIDLIRKSNQLSRDIIHPGDRLRVFKTPLAITVSKSRNELLLKANDVFFKRYRVGTGQFGKTPVGAFFVADKIAEPPWWRPDGKMIPYGDKENVLGTRWMSIVPAKGTPPASGYGIHGTWDPETIGKQASAGCIRLLNNDVEELFLLTPVGTPVVITE
jgi:lipoprotein-anchoring transpeptidase ErfK/SrfK